jgi:peptidoglycan-N-acetylglucosamine deacetylase
MVLATILVALAIGGVFIFGQKRVKELPAAAPETSTITPWASMMVKEGRVEESGKGYKITAVYPVTKSETVNQYFTSFVTDTITQFKQDTAWVSEPDAQTEGQDLSLDLGFIERKTNRADNYTFTTTTYTGGAHGLETNKTFSFTEAGKLINWKDLFTDSDKGLDLISTYVQNELQVRNISNKDWILEGAGPTEDNYQNFLVTDQGITILFDPYQVAPYAAGPQTVDVPMSVFQKVANQHL